MDHPCHKCNQPVEDGIPFCSHCGAPQIRVAIAEAPLSTLYSPEDAGNSTDSATLLTSRDNRPPSLHIRWSEALRPCALAAMSALLPVALGLYPLVAAVGAGFLSVFLYRRRSPGTVIKAAAGAWLGALSGLLWFGMSAVLGAMFVAVLNKGPELRRQILERLDQAARQTSDPQTLAVFEQFKTPSGLAVMMLLGFVFAFFLAIVLASIGGALGGTLLSRGDRK